MLVAITRGISPRMNECEITHIDRIPIDMDKARSQHRAYVSALKGLGCKVVELPPEPDLPDSVFVEDTAFILPHIAVLTRPGADSRKLETESIAQALAPYTDIIRLESPATLDGGDVLVMGKRIFIGLSTRSNLDAIKQLRVQLQHHGYAIEGIPLKDCLHLKSAVTRVDDKTLLVNPAWVEERFFRDFELIQVDPAEPFAGNCLPINGSIVYSTSFPKTQAKLEAAGFQIVTVEADELAKAEGAVTCCSLIIARDADAGRS